MTAPSINEVTLHDAATVADIRKAPEVVAPSAAPELTTNQPVAAIYADSLFILAQSLLDYAMTLHSTLGPGNSTNGHSMPIEYLIGMRPASESVNDRKSLDKSLDYRS